MYLPTYPTRGVNDIHIACTEGLKGFPDAIRSVYPDTSVLLRVGYILNPNFHQIVDSNNQTELPKDLKCVYQAVSKEAAEENLSSWKRHRRTVSNRPSGHGRTTRRSKPNSSSTPQLSANSSIQLTLLKGNSVCPIRLQKQ